LNKKITHTGRGCFYLTHSIYYPTTLHYNTSKIFLHYLMRQTFFQFMQNNHSSTFCIRSDTSDEVPDINLLKAEHNLLYIRNQSVPRCKHFPPWL